jgi:hypothetical protein
MTLRCPGLADAIEFLEASTLLTGFRYTSNPCRGIKRYQNAPPAAHRGRVALQQLCGLGRC